MLKSGNTSATYLLSRIPKTAQPKEFLEAFSLKGADVVVLRAAAAEDARRYIYNALASFIGGINSLCQQEGAWAVTKMYYSAFYLSRATLCLRHTIIFHALKDAKTDSHTQFICDLTPGTYPRVSRISSTHKLVATLFAQSGYPAFMRSLQIDGLDPLRWLMREREYWQYRCGRFADPSLPPTLAAIKPEKMSLFLETYAKDTSGVYLADESHALVSVPFRLLTWSLQGMHLLSAGVIDDEDIRHLRRRCRPGGRKLSALDALLRT